MGEDSPYQVALGGGEPGCNPNFAEFLRKFAENNIVPNYTTNGYTLLVDEKNVKATVEYCGGVALTYHWHDTSTFKQALEILSKLPIQRNVHIIVSHKHIHKIKQAIDDMVSKVDTIVLLEFHAVGRGKDYKDWLLTKEDIEYIKHLLTKYPSGKLAVGASLIPIAILIIAFTLWFGFKHIDGIILPLLNVGIAVVWTLGLMGLFHYELTMVSNTIPVILLAVGSAYSIHVINHFRTTHGHSLKERIIKSLPEVSIPVFFASITTIIGFLSFIFGSYLTMISNFGLFTATGIFFALIFSILSKWLIWLY
jgi:hypothetical protein